MWPACVYLHSAVQLQTKQHFHPGWCTWPDLTPGNIKYVCWVLPSITYEPSGPQPQWLTADRYLGPDEALIAAERHGAAQLKLVSVPLTVDRDAGVVTFILTERCKPRRIWGHLGCGPAHDAAAVHVFLIWTMFTDCILIPVNWIRYCCISVREFTLLKYNNGIICVASNLAYIIPIPGINLIPGWG